MKNSKLLAGALLAIMMSATSVLNAQWLLTGNAGTTPGTNYIGTTDAKALVFKTNGTATTGERMRITSSGQVGIGTTAPQYALHVVNSSKTRTGYFVNSYSGTSNKQALYGYSNSNGTATKYGVYGTAENITDNEKAIGVYGEGTGNSFNGENIGLRGIASGYGIAHRNYGVYATATGSSGGSTIITNYGIYATASGVGTNWAGYFDGRTYADKLCLGTQDDTYRLNVCGTIRAEEVRVATGWCDFVFADDYELRPLSEVEEFVKIYKHLPDVYPGAQIESEGLEVGKTSAQMIRKIEELTLYVIQLNNTMKEKEKQINDLNDKVKMLLNK